MFKRSVRAVYLLEDYPLQTFLSSAYISDATPLPTNYTVIVQVMGHGK
jgi:hypothetical protein